MLPVAFRIHNRRTIMREGGKTYLSHSTASNNRSQITLSASSFVKQSTYCLVGRKINIKMVHFLTKTLCM